MPKSIFLLFRQMTVIRIYFAYVTTNLHITDAEWHWFAKKRFLLKKQTRTDIPIYLHEKHTSGFIYIHIR